MITSIYPVVMTTEVEGAAAWFAEAFGFETTFASDWYVSMRTDAGELAFLDPTHESIPVGFGAPAAGVLVNIEVDDVDGEFARLSAGGSLRIVQELRSEDFGQRHFIALAPGGILVDVIEPIPPTGAFA